MNRDLFGTPSGLSSIFNKNAYDPVHQVIRMDLAFAAVGAKFGSSPDSIKSVDVDNVFRKLILDGKDIPPEIRSNVNVLDHLVNINRRHTIFSPNSAFDLIFASP